MGVGAWLKKNIVDPAGRQIGYIKEDVEEFVEDIADSTLAENIMDGVADLVGDENVARGLDAMGMDEEADAVRQYGYDGAKDLGDLKDQMVADYGPACDDFIMALQDNPELSDNLSRFMKVSPNATDVEKLESVKTFADSPDGGGAAFFTRMNDMMLVKGPDGEMNVRPGFQEFINNPKVQTAVGKTFGDNPNAPAEGQPGFIEMLHETSMDDPDFFVHLNKAMDNPANAELSAKLPDNPQDIMTVMQGAVGDARMAETYGKNYTDLKDLMQKEGAVQDMLGGVLGGSGKDGSILGQAEAAIKLEEMLEKNPDMLGKINDITKAEGFKELLETAQGNPAVMDTLQGMMGAGDMKDPGATVDMLHKQIKENPETFDTLNTFIKENGDKQWFNTALQHASENGLGDGAIDIGQITNMANIHNTLSGLGLGKLMDGFLNQFIGPIMNMFSGNMDILKEGGLAGMLSGVGNDGMKTFQDFDPEAALTMVDPKQIVKPKLDPIDPNNTMDNDDMTRMPGMDGPMMT